MDHETYFLLERPLKPTELRMVNILERSVESFPLLHGGVVRKSRDPVNKTTDTPTPTRSTPGHYGMNRYEKRQGLEWEVGDRTGEGLGLETEDTERALGFV